MRCLNRQCHTGCDNASELKNVYKTANAKLGKPRFITVANPINSLSSQNACDDIL